MPVDVESYSLSQTAVFCKQWSKIAANFVFKVSAFRFDICVNMKLIL